jgi:putative transposase
MPRKLLIRTSDFPYHITNRSNNRDFFYIEQSLLWPIFIKSLHQLTLQFKCEIHSFVLMSNHYHLMISTPEANIGEAMKYLHREVARQVNRSTGRMNHFFGARYKWSVISENDYYWNCIKYVFRNPVRAGMCNHVQTYEFSSLNREAQLFSWKLSDFFLDSRKVVEMNVEWLNEPFQSESEELIRKGLRRREFQIPKDSSGRLAALDVPLYKKGTVT